jgi:hypothetical protein
MLEAVAVSLVGKLGASRVALVDGEDARLVLGRRWCLHTDGYAVCNGVYMHRVILGIVEDGHRVMADHRNHDRLDNRRANLRVATPRQNAGNKARPPRCIRRTDIGSYVVKVARQYVGTYATLEEALVARNAAHAGAYGEFSPFIAAEREVPSGLRRTTRARLACVECGVPLSRKASTPSAIRVRGENPPRCREHHLATMSAKRWPTPGLYS